MEGQKTIAILSDSYLTPKRLKYSGVNNFLKIRGHRVAPQEREVRVVNLAKGGQTFKKVLENKELLQAWIISKPTVSLIHLGPVDIVNREVDLEFKDKDLSFGVIFKNVIVNFVNKLEEVAKNFLGDNFDAWKRSHSYILCALPDWRDFNKKYEHCLNSDQYRHYRKRINKYLHKNIGKFLREYGILIIAPGTANANYSGVHLVATSQRCYNDRIINAIRKVLCPACRPEPTWSNKVLYEQNFTENKICRGNK